MLSILRNSIPTRRRGVPGRHRKSYNEFLPSDVLENQLLSMQEPFLASTSSAIVGLRVNNG
jgi:hypothetical protein